MVVNLSIPDELYAHYVTQNPQNPGKAMVKQLKRFAGVKPGDRAITVFGDDLAELQRVAARSVETPKQVIKLVEDALTCKGEGIEIRLTDGQRGRIRQDAKFWQQDPGVYASKEVQVIVDARFGA